MSTNAKNVLIVSNAIAVAFFTELGLQLADKWSPDRMNKKLAITAKIINDPEQVDPAAFKTKETKKLFKDLQAAFAAGKTAATDASEAPAEEAPAPAAKPAKSALADEGEEAPAPAAKPVKAGAKPAAKSAKVTPAAKPAKSSAKAATTKVERDYAGGRVGSMCSGINLAVGKKAKTTDEIATETKAKKVTVSAQLHTLKAKGLVVKTDKGWTRK